MLLNKLKGHGVAAGRDTVGARIVGSLDRTVLSTVVRAGALVGPLVAVVAILVATESSSQFHVQDNKSISEW